LLIKVVPDAAELDPAAGAELLLVPAAGVLAALELPAELPQAATVSATAANPAAAHMFRITKSPLQWCI
jgi:hypothetical protein